MPTSGFSGDTLRRLLVTDIATGAPDTRRAAVHLLTFTELLDRPGSAELVQVTELDEWDEGDTIQIGQVHDWAALLAFGAAAGLSDDDQRMVALAVSLAIGQPVDLAANGAVSGHTHARRVIEAIAIATGHSEMYAVTPTAKPGEMPARRDDPTR